MAAGILNDRRLLAAGLAAMLVLAFLATAASPAPAQRAGNGTTGCPAMKKMYTGGIRVKRVSCKEAKAVITTYIRRIVKNLQHDWSLTVHHLDCDLVTKYYWGDIHRCVGSGGREIDFWRGSKPPPPKRY
jgi:hypothetical protein